MRTDSTNLSQDALSMVRGFIGDNFGKNICRKTPTSTPAKKLRKRTKRFVLLMLGLRLNPLKIWKLCAETVSADLAPVCRLSDDAGAIRFHHYYRGRG
jgi:hypothetical protein